MMKEKVLHLRELRQNVREVQVLWSQFQVSRLELKQSVIQQRLAKVNPDTDRQRFDKLNTEYKQNETILKEARTVLAEREEKLKVHTDALAKAGVKDTIRQLPDVKLIFEQNKHVTLADILETIHRDATTDQTTTNVLQTIMGIDPQTINNNTIRDQLTEFYGGTYETMAKIGKQIK